MVLVNGDITPAVRRRRNGGTPVVHGLLDTLARWGVRRIYCCPGSTEAAMLDALVARDDIRLVLVTHESVAVAMAEGEARITGRPAVAYLHTNVGMANGLAHLTSAQLAYAPVLVLNGLKATTLAGRRAFTSADHPRDMVRQHVKWAQVSVSAGQVPDDADRALHAAVSEPAGPVWLGLPQDLLESDAPVPTSAPGRSGTSSPVRAAAAAVAAAAELLASAHRPVLVAGADVARSVATDALVAVAERLGAPIVEEDRRDFSTSVVPTRHPLHAGRYDPSSPLIVEADVIAFLGCRMFTEFEAPGSPAPPAAARVVHLHADPAEVGRLHRVDAALIGDAALTLVDLLAALPPGRRPAAAAAAPKAPAPPARPRFPGHVNLGARGHRPRGRCGRDRRDGGPGRDDRHGAATARPSHPTARPADRVDLGIARLGHGGRAGRRAGRPGSPGALCDRGRRLPVRPARALDRAARRRARHVPGAQQQRVRRGRLGSQPIRRRRTGPRQLARHRHRRARHRPRPRPPSASPPAGWTPRTPASPPPSWTRCAAEVPA